MDITFVGTESKEIGLQRINMKGSNFSGFTISLDFFNSKDMLLLGFKEHFNFKDIIPRNYWLSCRLDPATFDCIAANRGISQPVSAIRFRKSFITGDDSDGSLCISQDYPGQDFKISISWINF